MNRIKERWDLEYAQFSELSAQCLRDNAARFKKDASIMNLMLVKNAGENNEENQINRLVERDENVDAEDIGQERNANNQIIQNRGRQVEIVDELLTTFRQKLQNLEKCSNRQLPNRDKLIQLKVKEADIKRANEVLESHLENCIAIEEIIDAVYAMGLTIQSVSGVKPERHTDKNGTNENRRIRKIVKTTCRKIC